MNIESNSNNLDRKTFFSTGAICTARSLFLTSCTHPIDIIKIRMQDAKEPKKVRQIASEIFKSHGVKGFYQGLTPQLTRLSIKEWWRWPAIIYLPTYLEKKHHLSSVTSQILTGLFISTVDVVTTAPLERHRIRSMVGKSDKPSAILKYGWLGVIPLWWKTSVGWIAFSLSQRLVRDGYKKITHKEKLNSLDTVLTGTAVGIIVALSLAPFDVANTQGQSSNVKMLNLIKSTKNMTTKNLFSFFFRGSHLQMLIFSIHNITSVALIENLSKNNLD